MLLTLEHVLPAEAVCEARALLARAPWQDGRLTAGTQAAPVKHNEQVAPGAELQALQALVLQALEQHPVFFSAALPKRVLPPLFNRYGGERNTYGNHVDQAVRYVPGSGQGLVPLTVAYALLPLAFKALAGLLLWRWRHSLEI